MHKKNISMAVALMMTMSLFAVPAMAETESDDGNIVGYLSYLNMSEEDLDLSQENSIPAYNYLADHDVMEITEQVTPIQDNVFYDSLDAMLMSLTSGEVGVLSVPDSTAKYLTNVNDQVKQVVFWYPEKAEGFSQDLLNWIGNGYSFMMLAVFRHAWATGHQSTGYLFAFCPCSFVLSSYRVRQKPAKSTVASH